MWSVTVKTLDGQNHKFDEVDPDKTVAELKEQISGTVGIESVRQRLIFCGRVLQDDKKLSEYEVDGRVVHLVQRPPPGPGGPTQDRLAESEARARESRGGSPQVRHRHTAHFHVHGGGPGVAVGGPTVGAIGQSSPQVRLNLARDMVRQANELMDQMEGRTPDPSSSTSTTNIESSTVSSGPTAPVPTTTATGISTSNVAPGVSTGSSTTRLSTGPTTVFSTTGNSTGFSTGPIHMMGIPAEATATIHVQTEGGQGGNPPAGLAEAISAMVQQATSAMGGVTGGQQPTSTESPTEDSPAGIRHPPPSSLADVLELYNTAQTRLATHSSRLTTMLRDDPELTGDEMTLQQNMFNNYSACLHYLSHAQHAMSDIMINLSRPPPRQVRARPFVIQSVVQSAVVQAVSPMMSSGQATSSSSSTTTSTTTSSSTPSSGTSSIPTVVPNSTTPSATAHNAAHAAAHAAAVAAATGGTTTILGGTNATRAGPTFTTTGGIPTSLGQLINSSLAGQQGEGPQVQPVVVGIELGPEISITGGPTAGQGGLGGIINSAIQDALRGQGGAQQGTPGGPNPQVQVAMGPPLNLPMGGPPPMSGNLNSFDPFLTCSSHHVSRSRGQRPSRVLQPTRVVRSAPSSRSPSVTRRQQQPPVGTVPPPGGAGLMELLAAQHSTENGDQNMVNMIQGVMRQVVGVLGGGGGSTLTISQFLNTLPDYNYVAGESIVTDLFMTLADHLTFQDMVSIVARNPSPACLQGLQEPLKRFINGRLLAGSEPSRSNVETALVRLMDDRFTQMEAAGRVATVRDTVDYPETLHNFLSVRPVELIMLILESDNQTFVSGLGPCLRGLLGETAALSLHCFSDDHVSLERVVEDRLGSLTDDVGQMIRQWTVSSAISHLRTFVNSPEFPDLVDLDRWIVLTRESEDRRSARAARLAVNQPQPVSEQPPAEVESMEVVDQPPPSVRTASRSIPAPDTDPMFPPSLLNIPPSTDNVTTDQVLPRDWVPIIARDMTQMTARQEPFSDGYLAGQPSKRRKLNTDKKPTGDVRSLISQSLQEALDQTGIETVTNSDSLIREVVNDARLQRAVEDVTRQTIMDRVEGSQDCRGDRLTFPATESFTKKQQ